MSVLYPYAYQNQNMFSELRLTTQNTAISNGITESVNKIKSRIQTVGTPTFLLNQH